jgi:ATP-dependent helicase/nuclease subunit A
MSFQPTLEQQAAIDDRDGELLVTANAGSGKTAVMVRRIRAAVAEDGVPPGRILAITFTEKAAAELRERARAELGAATGAAGLEGAWISTIHGFCARILRAHALDAGIDPSARVLEEAEARRLEAGAFAAAQAAWAERHGAPAVELAAAYEHFELEKAIRAVHDVLRSRGERAPRLSASPAAPDPAPLRAALAAAAPPAARELALCGDGAALAETLRRVERCIELLEDDEAMPSPVELGGLGPFRKIKAHEGAAYVAYAEALAAYRDARAAALALPALALLDDLLAEHGARYAAAKRERGTLDFADLELETDALLERDPALRARLQARFDHVMVDEFQDTNPLQARILDRIAPGRLVAVGDARQSIYGFRHADLRQFERRRTALSARDRERPLSTSFRSRAEILDVVNRCFHDQLGEGFPPLLAGRDDAAGEPGESPRVELLLVDRDGFGGDGEDQGAAAREHEARAVARRVVDLLDRGTKRGEVVLLFRSTGALPVFEAALADEGVPTYVVAGRGYWSSPPVRDLVAWLAVLANPRDERRLVTVLASPLCGVSSDALAILARARRRPKRPLWDVVAGVADPEPPAWAEGLTTDDRDRLRALTELVRAERRAAERLPLDELLERALEATGYDLALLRRPGGRRGMANVRKLLRLAAEHAASAGHDLRGFVDRADRLSRESDGADLEAEAPVEGEAVDAVRLMTIHRAKGLEFGAVVVADLGRRGPNGRPFLLVGEDGRVGLRLALLGEDQKVDALDYRALTSEAALAEDAEERRLLYVAMTRAREHLVLSGGAALGRWREHRPGGPAIQWLAPLLLGAAPGPAMAQAGGGVAEETWDGRPARVRWEVVTAPAQGALALEAAGLLDATADGAGTEPMVRAAVAVARAPEPPPPAPSRLSYTQLHDHERCGYRFYLERELGLPRVAEPEGPSPSPGEPGALPAATRGTIAHALLEKLDPVPEPAPPSAEDVLAVAAESAPELGRTLAAEEVEELRALVGGVASSSLWRRIAAAGGHRREAPFAFATGPLLLTGFIDLLCVEADGTWLIVDWKTDRLDGADPSAVAARDYEIQREVYALAAIEAGARAVEIVHCFTERPDDLAVERRDAAEAGALHAAIQRRAEGLRSREHSVAARPDRQLCRGCPGRGSLCSWPREATEADPPSLAPQPA